MTKSIDFFETQFRQQLTTGEPALNPFELLALPYLSGWVVDFGCGLGVLAYAAARQGCRVLALDVSPTAIRHLADRGNTEQLAIEAVEADLRTHQLEQDFDTVVCVGLLMFFDCATARAQLAQLQARTKPGGVAVINVLIEGTTFRAMFDPDAHCLFHRDELREVFSGWDILVERFDEFLSPGDTVKSFATLIARKPSA